MSRQGLKRQDDRGGPSKAEITVISTSVVVTVTLFVYVLVQAVLAPDGPHLMVEVERTQDTSAGVEVHVLLRNRGEVGVLSATVEVACVEPPVSITFHNVAAHGHRRGVVVCPPGSDPTARVSAWVEA